jgi:hypothetical protein
VFKLFHNHSLRSRRKTGSIAAAAALPSAAAAYPSAAAAAAAAAAHGSAAGSGRMGAAADAEWKKSKERAETKESRPPCRQRKFSQPKGGAVGGTTRADHYGSVMRSLVHHLSSLPTDVLAEARPVWTYLRILAAPNFRGAWNPWLLFTDKLSPDRFRILCFLQADDGPPFSLLESCSNAELCKLVAAINPIFCRSCNLVLLCGYFLSCFFLVFFLFLFVLVFPVF